MNTVGPYHNRQETYAYFSLPFCRGSKVSIGHYHETLGEALLGVELDFSGLNLQFKGVDYFGQHFRLYRSFLVSNAGSFFRWDSWVRGGHFCSLVRGHPDNFGPTSRK